MKFVTLLADFDGAKCIYFLRYDTKLLAFARNARFSNNSTTAQKHKESYIMLYCKLNQTIWAGEL